MRRRRSGSSGRGSDDWYGWRPYVPVAARREDARRQTKALEKKGLRVQPIAIEGTKIAHTFWGQAWCKHLEKFSDYANRLPRGRTYVRNGSVCHLEVNPGSVKAMVQGSEMYNVDITIQKLPDRKWREVRRRCAGQIGSLLELLQGKLSGSIMGVVTDRDEGLFPLPDEIELHCDCPDWAVMCKHVAAVLYGVGARLDEKPEMLFHLRGVDHDELVCEEASVVAAKTAATGRAGRRRIAEDDLGDVFGIEVAKPDPVRAARPVRTAAGKGRRAPKPAIKTSPSAARKTRPVTGKAVAQLRSNLELSRVEFARLLGVSVATISNWERARGRLNLQPRTLEAWQRVAMDAGGRL